MEIGIINMCDFLSSEKCGEIIQAIQNVLPIFCKDWNIPDCKLVFSNTPQIKLVISKYSTNRRSNTTGVTAFHTIEKSIPIARVIIDNKIALSNISRMISHEIFDILINPMQNRYSNKYEVEVCDPVMCNSFLENGISISDWVLPAWFDTKNKEGPYNHLKTITSPFTILPGGYLNKEKSLYIGT